MKKSVYIVSTILILFVTTILSVLFLNYETKMCLYISNNDFYYSHKNCYMVLETPAFELGLILFLFNLIPLTILNLKIWDMDEGFTDD
jgi:hypothetical protein